MSKFKKTGFIASFRNAFRGIQILWKSEKNFRTHSLAGFLVFLTALLFDFDFTDLAILALTVGLVMVTEMINTAIEFTLDAVYKNKYSKLVGMAKDIAAGAVMLSASASVVIGLLLFWKNIFD